MIQPRVPLNGQMFEKFCKGNSKSIEAPFFQTQAQLLVFAAALGCENDLFEVNPDTKSDSIKESVFRNNNLLDRMRFMALYKAQDPKILDNDDDISKIVESYAHGGFEIMKSWLEEEEEENYFFDRCKQEVLKRSPAIEIEEED